MERVCPKIVTKIDDEYQLKFITVIHLKIFQQSEHVTIDLVIIERLV